MISVAMATYNGAKYIEAQLSSILPQLSAEDEVVVSDDGSSDDTLQRIASLNDVRIRVFSNEGKHGVVGNFENALKQTKGDVIFFCDQDDVWTPNKVEVCLKALQSADLVVHDLDFCDENGQVFGNGYFSIRNSGPGFFHNLYKNGFMGSCMAFTRRVKEAALPFPENILWHDMWVGLVAERKFNTVFLQDRLLRYRRHGNNASPTGESSDFSIGKRFSYRWTMLYNVLMR